VSVTRKTLAVGGALAAMTGSVVVTGAAALAGLAPIPQVGLACTWSRLAQHAIPASYRIDYASAGLDAGEDCAVLAGVGRIESDHGGMGRAPCPTSSKGARGPMQFLPSTWALPGIGNGGNICDPADAIPATARYLKKLGAPGNYRIALAKYNCGQPCPAGLAYADQVLAWANRYRGRQVIDGRGDYLNPFPVGQWIPGRTDQGVDMCPLGQRPVRLIGRATIGLSQQIASGWLDGGELTYTLVDGDHAGVSIYFAEDFVPTRRASSRVWPAGTVIGHAFDGHHCIEQGFAAGPTTDAPESPYKRQGLPDGGNTTGGLEMTRWMRELGAQTQEDPGPGPDHP
jgi:hypothetical protein